MVRRGGKQRDEREEEMKDKSYCKRINGSSTYQKGQSEQEKTKATTPNIETGYVNV